jgi:hypothetical protein
MKKLLLTSLIIAGLMIASSAMAVIPDGSTWIVSVWYNGGGVSWDNWTFDMDYPFTGTIQSSTAAYENGIVHSWANLFGRAKVLFRFPNNAEYMYGTLYPALHGGGMRLWGVAVSYMPGTPTHGLFYGTPAP